MRNISIKILKMRIAFCEFLCPCPLCIILSSNALSEYILNLNVCIVITILVERIKRQQFVLILEESGKDTVKDQIKESDLINYFLSNEITLK